MYRIGDGAKERGAYYTPAEVVSSLVRWAVRQPTDRLLDPSCGGGRFIAKHSSRDYPYGNLPAR